MRLTTRIAVDSYTWGGVRLVLHHDLFPGGASFHLLTLEAAVGEAQLVLGFLCHDLSLDIICYIFMKVFGTVLSELSTVVLLIDLSRL